MTPALLLIQLEAVRALIKSFVAALVVGAAFWAAAAAAQEPGRAETVPLIAESEIDGLYKAQLPMLRGQTAALAAQRPGIADLYFVGFAGWAPEDVFMREVRLVRALFDRRFDTERRSLLLINHPDAIGETPLATVVGLDWALWGLAGVMDVEEDILFLHLTSHGTDDHRLGIAFPPLATNDLAAGALRRMLDKSGIKWRVVVVSACYSGGFIDALANENSLIITSSHRDRPSFGCANGYDYTYFGRAFYDQALRGERSFIDAFATAARLVTDREREDGFDPSLPQISVGASIEGKLAALLSRLDAKAPRAPKVPRSGR